MIIPEILIVVLLGLIFGSFATAMIYRIPRGHPWAFATKKHAPDDITAYRSACPHCKTKLGFSDLVPIVSWMLARGRCRHCQAPIGKVYPLTELGVVAACLLVYMSAGFTPYGFFLLALVPFLAALLVIDLEHMILPNELVFIVGGLAVGYLALQSLVLGQISIEHALINYGLAGAVFAAFSWGLGWFMGKVLKKEALGFGDVKFFAVAGLWLGVAQLPAFCMLSGLFGVGFAVLWQMFTKEKVFPFGPALISALFMLLLFDGSFFL